VTQAAETIDLLTEAVSEFDGVASVFGRDWSVDELARALVAIRDARSDLALVAERLEKELCTAAGEKVFVVEGVGQVEIKGKVRRVKWDKESLLRAVLDSRLVNEATGEVVEETPVDRVLHVWNLGAPRLFALRARRIDEDQFCEATFEGWTVRLPGAS
jgi:hypothetical protein